MTSDDSATALADWIARDHRDNATRLIGLNGAQGSGKSTLAKRLTDGLAVVHGLRVAVLGLDDLYLTHAERQALAADVHPLLATRGVPGTHDVAMGLELLARLPQLGPGEPLAVPRFLKSLDDRAPRKDWRTLTGPFDLLLFEGWCVATPPQTEGALREPINSLEAEADADGCWRHWVNAQLASPYQSLFAPLQRLIYLQAPSFHCVLDWRLQQERAENAREAADRTHRLMDVNVLRRFIAHYERLTRHALEVLPRQADALLVLTAARDVHALRIAETG